MSDVSVVVHPFEALLGASSTGLQEFLDEVTSYTISTGLPLEGHEIDHVCYRCESKAQYKDLLSAIVDQDIGSVLIESMIGGRPITIVTFTHPIQYKEWSIACLEVTCPKAGRVHKHGFEHIEVVIDPENNHGFIASQEFLTQFAAKYTTVTFDTKAIHKEVNADLSLTTPAGNSVKFHARPIYEVCEYELSSGHHEAVPADYFA